MYNFFELNALSDNTWASVQLMSWTLAEPGIILICACVPSIWPILRRLNIVNSMSRKSGYSPQKGKSGYGSHQTEDVESQQRSEIFGWKDDPRSIHGGNNDTIPLRNVEEFPGGYEVSGSSSKKIEQHYGGIRVAQDFSATRPV